jgi:hypothetical protein
MMAYNPSIGRVFEKGVVNEFIAIALRQFLTIGDIRTRQDLDAWHDNFAVSVQKKIKTAKELSPSYGQAQKPINVFLKIYVDWASLPDSETAQKLRPHLHVPLDSVVMGVIEEKSPQFYQKYELETLRLAEIDRDLYLRWQSCFRRMSPEKPLLLDIASYARQSSPDI